MQACIRNVGRSGEPVQDQKMVDFRDLHDIDMDHVLADEHVGPAGRPGNGYIHAVRRFLRSRGEIGRARSLGCIVPDDCRQPEFAGAGAGRLRSLPLYRGDGIDLGIWRAVWRGHHVRDAFA